VDGHVPQPDAWHAFVREADPADALLAFEHRIVTTADGSELQHILAGFVRVLERTTPHQPNILAEAALVTH
jgi:hypothetical protein